MDAIKWTLLISSALLYAAAFMFSPLTWWVVFICFVPLFYAGVTRILSFKEGFLYGILVWTLHIHAILYSIFIMAKGPFLLRLLPSVFILIFQAFFVGVWFFLASTLIRLLHAGLLLRFLIWVGTAWLYFYFLETSCLAVFNTWEGYSLMSPLLPLAEKPQLLAWMPRLGGSLLLLLLVSSNALIAACFLVTCMTYRIAFLLVGLAPWLFQAYRAPKPEAAPSWLERVVWVPVTFYDMLDLGGLGKRIQEYTKTILEAYIRTRGRAP